MRFKRRKGIGKWSWTLVRPFLLRQPRRRAAGEIGACKSRRYWPRYLLECIIYYKEHHVIFLLPHSESHIISAIDSSMLWCCRRRNVVTQTLWRLCRTGLLTFPSQVLGYISWTKFVVRSPYFSVFWKARIRHATSLPIIKALTERLAGMETTEFAPLIPCAIFTATADQQDAYGSFN